MAPAKAEYTRIDENSGIREDLCESCWKIQKQEEHLRKLAEWTYEEDAKTVWLKVFLDFDELIETLGKLYVEYLTKLEIPNPEEKAEIRFSVASEFQWDYNAFLEQVNTNILSEFHNENVEQILDDFLCIKIEKLTEINKILDIYNKQFNNFFPRFKEIGSPIKLSLSCSNVKFPFFEHWQILQNPKNEISVNLIGRGQMNITINSLEKLIDLELPGKSALTKLVEIAETSEKLVELTLFGKETARDYFTIQKAVYVDKIGTL